MVYLILIVALIILRFSLSKFKSKKAYYLLCYAGATVPLVLLISGLIPKNAISLFIGGFCFLYFAMLAGIGVKKDKKNFFQ